MIKRSGKDGRRRVVTVKKPKRCPTCARMVKIGALGVLIFSDVRSAPDRPARVRSKLYHPDCALAAGVPTA
jgi:hypothetical protein